LTIGNSYFNRGSVIMPTQQVVDSDEKIPFQSGAETKNNSNSEFYENTDAVANSDSTINPKNSKAIPHQKKSEKESGLFRSSSITAIVTVSPKNEVVPESINDVSNEDSGTLKNNPKNEVVIANNSEETNNMAFDKLKADNAIKEIRNSDNNVTYAIDEEKSNYNRSEKKAMTIEEAMEKNNDADEKEKEHLNRWSLAPNAAPVFFNSMGKGSSIDPQFNNNSKSSELNMSYGINASYALNNKLSVRSGINKVNLGYNTNDVVVFQSVGASSNVGALKNVSPEGNADGDVSVLSTENFANESSESFIAGTSQNTSINQSLSYIEIPLEIKYMLSDKKLGIDVIGGFSSFFLSDNALYSDYEGNRTSIGKANNINNVSYSANFGLGLNYKVTKKLNLNLEPMFKYQFNTFNNTSGNFKPFFIGVYTGFGIKF